MHFTSTGTVTIIILHTVFIYLKVKYSMANLAEIDMIITNWLNIN